MKSVLTSRTFWLAVLQGAIGAAAAAISTDTTVQMVGSGAIVKSIADVALRFLTTQPVTLSMPPK